MQKLARFDALKVAFCVKRWKFVKPENLATCSALQVLQDMHMFIEFGMFYDLFRGPSIGFLKSLNFYLYRGTVDVIRWAFMALIMEIKDLVCIV